MTPKATRFVATTEKVTSWRGKRTFLISSALSSMLLAAAASYVPDLNVALVYAPGSGGSDHYSFWQVGYRAVEGIEEYLSGNPYYHQPSDLLVNYLDYFPFGTNCARAGIATVAALALVPLLSRIGRPADDQPPSP